MKRSPRFPPDQLREAIRREYGEVATNPSCEFHFSSGRPLAERLGYEEAVLRDIPPGAVESFAGVGNPFSIAPLREGEFVLDAGSGAGMDALIAARMVGPESQVLGVDLTDAMVAKATRNAETMEASNVEFRTGVAEDLPVTDGSVDVVISNGTVNLCPDKAAVFREFYRVLRPGGRLQIADILVETPVPSYVKDLIHLWTDCVAGGMPRAEYVDLLRAAGFQQVEVVGAFDVFEGAPVEAKANRYGARGFNLRAVKGGGPDPGSE